MLKKLILSTVFAFSFCTCPMIAADENEGDVSDEESIVADDASGGVEASDAAELEQGVSDDEEIGE